MPEIEVSQFKDRFAALIVGGQGFPKKQLDRHILFVSAAMGLEPGRTYTEGELNDQLRAWTAQFGEPVQLDHVTLRRFLVDEGYLQRDSAGASYELRTSDWPYTVDASIRTLDLEALVSEARQARALRKQQYLDRTRK